MKGERSEFFQVPGRAYIEGERSEFFQVPESKRKLGLGIFFSFADHRNTLKLISPFETKN